VPEGFDKAADLKIVISAATQPLQEGIKGAQSLIRSFSSEANTGLGALDGILGKVGVGVGALATRLNVVVGSVAAAGAVISQVAAVAEKVAKETGAGAEFDAVKVAANEVQEALLELAGHALTAVQNEAASAAVSLAGFETATASAGVESENFSQRALKKVSGSLADFAQTVRQMAPLEEQTYNTVATSLERVDDKIKEIEGSMSKGSQTSSTFAQSIMGLFQQYDDVLNSGGAGPEERLVNLRFQRDRLAEIVDLEKERWAATVDTPDADRTLGGIEREVRMLEAKAAALNLTAAAAATFTMQEKIRQQLEQESFSLAPEGEKRLEALIARYTEAQKLLADAEDSKKKKAQTDREDAAVGNVIKNLEREQATEERRLRTLGMTATEIARISTEEAALLQIRQAGREASEEELIIIRALASQKALDVKKTAEQTAAIQLLHDHAKIAGNALESAFSGWINGTEQSWKSLVAKMLEDMAMLALRRGLIEPFVKGTTDSFSGSVTGSAGSGGGNAIVDFFGSLFGGGGGGAGDWVTTVVDGARGRRPGRSRQAVFGRRAGPREVRAVDVRHHHP